MRKILFLLVLVVGCGKQGLETKGSAEFDKDNGNTVARFVAYNHSDRATVGFDGKVVFADVFGDVIAEKYCKYDLDTIMPDDSLEFRYIFKPQEFSVEQSTDMIRSYASKKLTTRFEIGRVVWK